MSIFNFHFGHIISSEQNQWMLLKYIYLVIFKLHFVYFYYKIVSRLFMTCDVMIILIYKPISAKALYLKHKILTLVGVFCIFIKLFSNNTICCWTDNADTSLTAKYILCVGINNIAIHIQFIVTASRTDIKTNFTANQTYS